MPSCPSFLRGRVLRATRLDACGRPVEGECGQVVSDGFITVNMSPEVEEGTETIQRKANGQICISDKAPDVIKWYTVTVTFCAVDIDLVTMINPTWQKLLSEDGETIGWAESDEFSDTEGFALEVWMNASGVESVCDNPDAEGSFGYVLLPWLVGGTVGELEIADGAVTFEFTGRTKRSSRWGVGPYNIRLNPLTSAPAQLPSVVQPSQQRLFLLTSLAPPESVCGCQTLTPVPPPALEITSAVEGATDTTLNLAWTNWGAGPVTIDWDDGASPTVAGPDTGSMTHVYVNAALHNVTVTDSSDVARTDAAAITTPFP